MRSRSLGLFRGLRALSSAATTEHYRTVLVTGAAKGIGASIAKRFADGGDRVVLHYRSDSQRAEKVRLSLPSPALHVCLQQDLADEGGSESLFHAALAACGHVDVLVCNHGIYEETPVYETDAVQWSESFARVLRANLAAPAELAFAFAKHARARGGGGAIVFVSSRGAFRGEPCAAAYGASKAGLNSLTGSLAQALGSEGIRVAAVAPGFVATEMAAPALASERGEGIRNQSPFARVGDVSEVAAAVHFLASDGGKWCTGAVLDCNGASYTR